MRGADNRYHGNMEEKYAPFAYDALGNLTEETTTADGKSRTLRHCYDPLGNRIQTVLPEGRTLNFTLCGSGFLHQITTAERSGALETVISAFERDDLQRETLRTQGRRQARSAYDPLSRLRERQSVLRRDAEGVLPGIHKEFAYDKSGELTSRRDNFLGLRTYAYDAAGRVTGSSPTAAHSFELKEILGGRRDRQEMVEALFKEEKFAYDPASNLLSTGTDDLPLTVFRPTRPSDYDWARFDTTETQHVRHNRLREFNGLLFTYDTLGRTIEKTDQDNQITWNYKYNCESQLTEVTIRSRRSFRRVRFAYDALGRRVGKTDGKTETRFLWDGMQLLQEERGDTVSTYLYEQDSYVPLARMDMDAGDKAPRVYYFHCNASGQPEEMTDAEGQVIWRARYATWGKVVFENVTKAAPQGFEQNLRMQGQYADRETELCYNTFRYYDADVGRFTCEDPISLLGGENLYQYAPNPISWIDPWGWDACGGTKGAQPKRTQHVPNRHIRRHNNVKKSKFTPKERAKLQAKSKYKKPSQYKKLEDRTMKDPSRVIHQGNGRIRYERDYDRVIGTRGEKGHVTIFDPAKGKVITSYPSNF